MFDKLPALNATQNARLAQAAEIRKLSEELASMAQGYVPSEWKWNPVDMDPEDIAAGAVPGVDASDTERRAFVTKLEALIAKLEAIDIIGGDQVPTASKETVDNISPINR